MKKKRTYPSIIDHRTNGDYNYPSIIGHRTDGDYHIDLQKNNSNNGFFPLHFHVNFEVVYQISGKREYDYFGEKFTLHEGDVLLIPPHTMHGTLPQKDYFSAYVLGYTPTLIYSYDISFRNLKYLTVFADEHSFEQCRFSGDSETLCELRAEIVRLAEYGNSPVSELMARVSILRIHDLIYRLYNCTQNENISEFIILVQNCIEDRISEDISPVEIANLLHISHSSLCHRLKAELGCTPNELIMRCKLNYAEKLLLEQRELTVTDVGFEVGIPDTSYFIKCFKKSRGVTPGELRRLNDDRLNSLQNKLNSGV